MSDLQKITQAKVWNFLGPGFSTPFWTTIEIETKRYSDKTINLPTWIVLSAMKISPKKLAKFFIGKPVTDLFSNNIDWIMEKANEFNLSMEDVRPYIELGFLGAGEKDKWIEFSKLINKRINFYRREDAGTYQLKRTYFPIGFSVYRQHWFERWPHTIYFLFKFALEEFIRQFKKST